MGRSAPLALPFPFPAAWCADAVSGAPAAVLGDEADQGRKPERWRELVDLASAPHQPWAAARQAALM